MLVHNKVFIWGSDIDPQAILQAEKAARLPFVPSHVSLMPDAHVGIGATIGSVIPTIGAIIPSAIGVDIGCGMCAAETQLTSKSLPDNLDKLFFAIESKIPAGVGMGHADTKHPLFPTYDMATRNLTNKQEQTIQSQFGTLGSGNHFVEVCLDERDRVWIVLHSGSRGIGNQLAQQHIALAKGLMKEYFIKLEDPDLAYFVEGTKEFSSYIIDMLWAQNYAAQNRLVMLEAATKALKDFLGLDTMPTLTINCHHNYTEKEHHGGKDVWLTRKGAIRAREGDMGIIPGSMGTSTYIVKGLGNAASYNSCSHGAGRRMSRSQAKRELDIESLYKQMDGKTWNSDNAKGLLDEHPDAYKDIDQVMEDQKDLVKIEHSLTQILNYKGA